MGSWGSNFGIFIQNEEVHIVCKEQANDATREGPRQAVVSMNDGGMSCLVSFPTTGPVLGLCLEGGW